MAVLIGLESCPGCKIIHEAHPEIPYVVIPRINATGDPKIYEIKKSLGKLGISKYPVLLSDDYTTVISLETIDPRLKGYNED